MEFKIIEVTGAPGSGKSSYIKNNLKDNVTFVGYCPSRYNTLQRFLSFIYQLLKVWAIDLDRKQTIWLFERFNSYEETLWFKLNALRNALLKFTINFPKTDIVIIDEGISHIPFIFQLDRKNIQKFVSLFKSYLENREIFFISPPSEKELFRRLKARGHKRATSDKKLLDLIKKNLLVYNNYIMVLKEEEIPFSLKGS